MGRVFILQVRVGVYIYKDEGVTHTVFAEFVLLLQLSYSLLLSAVYSTYAEPGSTVNSQHIYMNILLDQ